MVNIDAAGRDGHDMRGWERGPGNQAWLEGAWKDGGQKCSSLGWEEK